MAKTKPLKALQQQLQRQGSNLTARQQSIELRREFSGPIPPPELLRGYNEVVPGSGEQIIRAFTKGMAVQRFRGIMEPINDLLGMVFSVALILAAGWVGYMLILADKDLAGWTALATALSVILVAFWSKKKRN